MVLVIERGPDTGRRWSVDKPAIIIGRAAGCDISLQDERVSGRHAQLRRQGDNWIVKDLNSHNGVWVNRQKLNAPHTLQIGDQLGLGRTVFSLQWEKEPPVYAQQAAVNTGDLLAGLADVIIAIGALLLIVGAWLPWLRVTLDVLLLQINVIAYGRDGLGTYTLIGGVLSLTLALGALIANRAGLRSRYPALRWSVLSHLPIVVCLLAMIALDLLRYYQSAEREIILGINLADLTEFAINWLNLKLVPQIGLILSGSGLALLLLGTTAGVAAAAVCKR
jgi:hypothetical protein